MYSAKSLCALIWLLTVFALHLGQKWYSWEALYALSTVPIAYWLAYYNDTSTHKPLVLRPGHDAAHGP
jgi:hypothetical protein